MNMVKVEFLETGFSAFCLFWQVLEEINLGFCVLWEGASVSF